MKGLLGLRGLSGLGLRPSMTTAQRIVKGLVDDGVLTDLGDPALYTVSTTRASVAKNIWTGADLAVNEPCRRLVPIYPGKSVYEYGVFQAHERRNDADLLNWVPWLGSASVLAGAQGDYDYMATFSYEGFIGHPTLLADLVSSSSYCLAIRARRISGDLTGLRAEIIDSGWLNPPWLSLDLSGLSDQWTTLSAVGTAAVVENEFFVWRDEPFGTPDAVVELQYVRLALGTHPLPFVPGAGEKVARAYDALSTAQVGIYPVSGGMLGAITPYAHALGNSTRGFPRWYDAISNNNAMYNVGDKRFEVRRSGVASIHAVQPAASERSVIAHDWISAADQRFWYGGLLRDTDAILAQTARDAIYIGHYAGDGNRAGNSGLVLLGTNRVLTDNEHAACSAVLGHGQVQEWRA